METIKVNMTPCEDIKTIHASQNDNEAREWGFELHNNGEKIDSSSISDQLVFKSYEGGTEQILPENGAVPVTAPFVGDIKYPDATRNDQEFLYRQSPTEKDGNANIKSLYGNTIVWNQLVKNGNFADTSNWSSSSNISINASNNILQVTNAVGRNGDYYSAQNIPMKVGHKYYFHAEAKKTDVSMAQTLLLVFFGEGSNMFAIDAIKENTNWVSKSTIFTCASNTYNFVRLRTQVANATNEFRNVVLIDLTQMGLDSVTVEEFTSLFPLPYYDYCQGAMLSFGGRNVKFNQLVQNGNFESTTGWGGNNSSITVANNVLTGTVTTSHATAGLRKMDNISFVANHKYLISAVMSCSVASDYCVARFYATGYDFRTDALTITANTKKRQIWTLTPTSAFSGSLYIYPKYSYPEPLALGDTFTFENVMLIDLTEMFGAGNEPSVEGFKELFPNDYYDYTTSQYMNLGQPVSLKTIGKNLIEGRGTGNIYNGGNLLPVKQGQEFWIYADYTTIGTTNLWCGIFSSQSETSKNTYIADMGYFASGTVKKLTASKDGYIGICYGSGVADYTVNKIMLSFASFTADEYEPYTESVLSIPLDEFPNGMDGINDARDEKNETGYVKRFGQVTFDGSENWALHGSIASWFYVDALLPNAKFVDAQTPLVNINTGGYESVGYTSAGALSNMQFTFNPTSGVSGRTRTIFKNTSYTTVEQWKAYLASNPLTVCYELATPLENYGVVDLGTLTYTIDAGNTLYAPVTGLKGVGQSEMPNILCALFISVKYSDRGSVPYPNISITRDLNIRFGNTGYTDVNAFKQAMQGVYLLYEKQNPQGFTTATLVTENGEVALANENGVLVGKCNSDVSADAGFIEGKIKLSDEDGDVYSNKIQIHVERKPS